MEKSYIDEYEADNESASPNLKIALLTAFIGFALVVVASPMAFNNAGWSHHLDTTVQSMTILSLLLTLFILVLLVIIIWLPQMDRHRVVWMKVGGTLAFISALMLVASVILAGVKHEIKAGTVTDYPTTFVIIGSVVEMATGILMIQEATYKTAYTY